MPKLEYEEFDLQLDLTGDGYSVRVVQSPIGSTGPEPFTLPGNGDTLKLLVLTLRAVRGVRSLESDTAPDAKKYGGELFDAVFHDDILSALRGSLHVASTMGKGLRVRLKFSDPSVLANIPWELLYDTSRHRFLSQYGKYPVVRYIDIPEPVSPLKVTGPVRMLVVISSPRDYPEIDTEKEWGRLSDVLKPFVDSGRLVIDRLPTASLASLHRALLEDEYHVFHYIGHGGVDPKSGDGVLALTGADGLSRLESGHDVGVMLSNSPIRLAVLNSCEGARISEVDPYASTAISLVQQGIPAVVAMQFEITDEAAFAFSSTLYDEITEGRPIDLAVTLARQAILATSRSEWATPVLYLRASDGVIFDITAPPPTPKEEEPPPAPPPPVPTPVAPGVPLGLTGTVVGRNHVELRWDVPDEGAVPAMWELFRDGAVVGSSSVPGLVDVVPGPGSYVYTVVALDDEGHRSPASEPGTVVVEEAPVGPPAPPSGEPTRTAPAPVAVLPAPPQLVAARASRGSVQLAWRQPATDASVEYWLVTRDGMTVGRVRGEPRAEDEHPGKGRHVYAVTAVGPGGGRSNPSDELAVTVGGGGRAWLALLLIPLAVLIWALFPRPEPPPGPDGPPLAPVNVAASVDGLAVTVTWETPEDDAPQPVRWIVLRDDAEVGTVDETRYTETLPEAGTYTYVVIAVGEDDLESPGAPPVRAVATTAPPLQHADLTTRFPNPAEATDGSEEITLRVSNTGPDTARDVRVTVRSNVPPTLLQVTMGSQRVRCNDASGTPVCRVAEIRAGRHLAMVVVIDRTGSGEAFTISALAVSDTDDPNDADNSATLTIETAPTPTTTTRPTVTILQPSPLTVTP